MVLRVAHELGEGDVRLIHVLLLDDGRDDTVIAAVGRTILLGLAHILTVIQHLLDAVHALFVEMHVMMVIDFLNSDAHG